MRVCVVAPAQDAGLGEILGEKVAEPVYPILSRPCFLPVAVEAMQCDDANAVS